jgi:NADP-dependent 3-hydroxy acid dehydrogenase YdfG
MQDQTGRVVAITGAAHGIGAQLARRYGAAGAALALSDVDSDGLALIAGKLEAEGVSVHTWVLDVRDAAAVDRFADEAFARFGGVDVLFNNAGVISAGTIWEEPLADWEWTLGVNVMGLVHGIRAFVPRMHAQDRPCDVVDTASIAGLLVVENSPAYVASKFAALSLTEVLDLQLQQIGSKVRAHAVCPAIVSTELAACNAYRGPDDYDAADPYYATADYRQRWAVVEGSLPHGMPVEQAVDTIVEGIEADSFVILTHPMYNPAITGRVASLLSGAHPSLVTR